MARTQDVWGAEGVSGRVKFLPLAWAGMPKTSFRKNSDSPLIAMKLSNIRLYRLTQAFLWFNDGRSIKEIGYLFVTTQRVF
ncbi:hypothetical protein [Bathymodiolus platifrons methanotrophic gill symbiont]|uniref:hypothetical protein n=1 Tax=Bathymodiolus platifrons methanotrophic gill symbiont TaxID=113268 RepID=UPI001C8F10DA|nr:hypothetical protein [Bathymodiolus platifrons methanotrophic gill symbiont]